MEVSVDNEVEIGHSNSVELSAANAANVEVTADSALDITVVKKEYKIVGDEVYIAKLYEDAPQWMKDLVQLVVDNTVAGSNTELINDVVSRLNTFATSYVPLNTYTQSILDLSNADTSIHALLETLNSTFNDGLNAANSQIVNLNLTKASKDEVITRVIETLAAQILTPTSELGAVIGNLQQAIVDGDSANADSITTLTSTLEGEVDARASAISTLNTYVGINEAGASTGTGLSAYLVGSDGKAGSADSQVANGIAVTNGVATSKWAYNSNLIVNGVSYVSGFGLSNSTGTGIGSEFWIDATKLKFTNSATTGRTAPFTIDASGTTPQITFNGKVSFSNVTDVPQLGSTPQDVVNAVNAGNTTTIDGGKITTGSIAAAQIAAGSVTADKIQTDSAFINKLNVTGGLVANNIRIAGVNGGNDLMYNSGGYMIINNLKILGTATLPGVSQAYSYSTGMIGIPSTYQSSQYVLMIDVLIPKPYNCNTYSISGFAAMSNQTNTGSSRDMNTVVRINGNDFSSSASGPYNLSNTTVGSVGGLSASYTNVQVYFLTYTSQGIAKATLNIIAITEN